MDWMTTLALWANLISFGLNVYCAVGHWRRARRYDALNELLRTICYNAWTMRHRPEMRSLYLDALIERMKHDER